MNAGVLVGGTLVIVAVAISRICFCYRRPEVDRSIVPPELDSSGFGGGGAKKFVKDDLN